MGLFDKLKNMMNASSDAGAPLQDEIVKKYFNIIYDMRTSRGWFGIETADANSRAKKYVEFVLGGPCDEARLTKAVELIKLSRTDNPITKLEKQVVDYRKSLFQEYKARHYKSAYGVDMKTAYKVCYEELLSDVKSKYAVMLNVDQDCEYFDDALKKHILDQYEPYRSSLVKDCICIAITDSFFDGNKTTKEVVLELLENEEDERLCDTTNPETIAAVVHNFIYR